eukprot:321585_1
MLNPSSKIVPQDYVSPDQKRHTSSKYEVRESSIDVDETLKLIESLDLNENNDNSLKKKILKLNSLKNKKKSHTNSIGKKSISSNNSEYSISRSLSQSASHVPPGVTASPQKKIPTEHLPSIDTSKLSSRSASRSISRRSSQSNLISSINSTSDYITPRSNTSVSSLSSMEWDTKNLKKYNKEKTKKK